MPVIINGSTGISGTDGSAATPVVQGTDTNTGMFFPAPDTIAFAEGGVESMRLNSSGNVGIGTTLPSTRLHISSSTSATAITVTNSSGSSEWQQNGNDFYVSNYNASGAAILRTNGTERMRIDSSGNVGIGTSSPIDRLNVSDGTVNFQFKPVAASSVGFFGIRTNHTLAFTTNDTERVRIDNNGNILIGTTSVFPGVFSNIGGFQVEPAGDGTSVFISRTGSFAVLSLNRGTDGDIAIFRRAAVAVGTISVSASNTSYNTSSDYRLKHDIQPMAGGLATVEALRPSTYKWNADGSYGEGFIAHELAEHIPLAVTGEKDAVNEDGSIKPQGVDYSKIVVHLVAAVQELSAKLEAAEARIATLEAR